VKLPLLRTFEDREAEERDELAAQVREARVELARREWTEIAPRERLVRRGPWLVDAETDALYVPRRGTTFEPGRAALISGQGAALWFYLDRDDVVVLEKVRSPASSSEHVERREARLRRAAR